MTRLRASEGRGLLSEEVLHLCSIPSVLLYLLTHVLWQSVAKFSDTEMRSRAPMLLPAATVYQTQDTLAHQTGAQACAC